MNKEQLATFLEPYQYGYKPSEFLVPVQDNDYGFLWPDGTSQLTIELWAYLQGGVDGRRKFDHLINCIRLQWPEKVEFVKYGIINTNIMRVLWACCYEKDLGVAGCASAGKTFPIACYALIDWMAAPNLTLTFVCTTSLQASDDRIWGTIVSLYKDAITQYGTLVEYKKAIVFGGVEDTGASDREYRCAIKALAIEQGLEGKKAIDTTRGRKNRRVRLIFDELPEMGLYVTKARVNLASNPELQTIGIGNPLSETDAHGEMCKPKDPDGYASISKDVPEWRTRTGLGIFLSGEWSPNFLVDETHPIPFDYCTNRKSLDEMLVYCYGNKDALEYIRNAIGFWSTIKGDQAILTQLLIKAYGANQPATWSGGKKKKVAGLDLGFSVGGDDCVAYFADVSEELSGRTVVQPFKRRLYHAIENQIFEDSIAKQVVDDCIEFGVEPDGLGMDISADGGKIAKAIIKYWMEDPELKKKGLTNPKAFDIVAISSMGKASERIVSDVDRVPCFQRYDRRVTEYWFNVRTAVLTGVLKGVDLELPAVAQFSARRYWKLKDKIYIETKDEMKLRLNGTSPDDADAFAYMIEMALRHGLQFITSSAWVNIINRRKLDAAKRFNPILANEKVGTYSSDSWGEGD